MTLPLLLRLVAVAAVLAASWPAGALAAPAPAAPPPASGPAYRFFPETGHAVMGKLRQFFDSHGGLDVFGFPRTDLMQENGLLVQYFQRGRLEVVGAQQTVQVSLLGDLIKGDRSYPPAPPTPNSKELTYFPQTSHSVHGAFLAFFNSRGGVETFGYPTSEEYRENGVTVQWFQRARFEYHPELPPAYQVSLSLLGDLALQKNNVPAAAIAAQPAPQPIAEGVSSFANSSANRVHNVLLMASKIDGVVVPPGATFSFNDVMGDVGPDAGWAEGIVIINRRSQPGLGGGICQVSTTVFRAAFWAGVPITERHDHTYPVPYYTQGGAPEGFDATVWSPQLDLKFQNDTGAPLVIGAQADRRTATLRIKLFGKKVERKVTLEGPVISNVRPAPEDEEGGNPRDEDERPLSFKQRLRRLG